MAEHDDDHAECAHDHADGDVDCQRVATLLTEYVEEGLSALERARLEDHLKYCPPCVEFMGQYQKASSTCREVLLRRVPSDLENRLVSFLRARCTSKTS